MHTHAYKELVEVGLAVKLEEPVFDRREVSADKYFKHAEMCIVVDEVCGNTNHKGDG